MDIKRIANELNNCTDEEFAEVFVTWYRNWCGYTNEITAEDMRLADGDIIGGKIADILTEVIHSNEVCSSVWWKKKKYRVWATMTSRVYLDVEATNEYEAWEIAEDTDGGDFIESETGSSWEIDRPILKEVD